MTSKVGPRLHAIFQRKPCTLEGDRENQIGLQGKGVLHTKIVDEVN